MKQYPGLISLQVTPELYFGMAEQLALAQEEVAKWKKKAEDAGDNTKLQLQVEQLRGQVDLLTQQLNSYAPKN